MNDIKNKEIDVGSVFYSKMRNRYFIIIKLNKKGINVAQIESTATFDNYINTTYTKHYVFEKMKKYDGLVFLKEESFKIKLINNLKKSFM